MPVAFEGSSTPINKKLARLKESRNNGKAKYAQLKLRVRIVEEQTRWFKTDRDNRKAKAQTLQEQLRLEKTVAVTTPPNDLAVVPVPEKLTGTAFSAEMALLIVRLVLEAAISTRASARVIEITDQVDHQRFLEGPSHNTARNLLQRIGLY